MLSLSQRTRRAMKRNAAETSSTVDSSNDSIDLTDSSFMSPNKSRRKLADEVGVSMEDSIDLSELEPVLKPVGKGKGKGRSRSQKAVVEKPKRKVSYKKALAAAKVPLMELQERPKRVSSKTIVPEPTPEPVVQLRARNTYDLTGDVELTSKHSSAPLFQKTASNQINKVLSQESHNTSQELFNIDFSSINVNIKINGKITIFKHQKDKRFYDLFKIIAEKENVPITHIFLFDGSENRILPDDTPIDINHKISTIYSKNLCKI